MAQAFGKEAVSASVKFSLRERASGGNRVIRGGSFNNSARNARASNRNRRNPRNRNHNLGFRVAVPAAPTRGLGRTEGCEQGPLPAVVRPAAKARPF